jgi:hypothetical protein
VQECVARPGFLETLECGEKRVLTKEITPGKPTTRRYTKQEQDQAVGLVFELRKALGTAHGNVIRIADQFVRNRVTPALGRPG